MAVFTPTFNPAGQDVTSSSGRGIEGYAKETVDATPSDGVAEGVQQVGTPVALGPYVGSTGNAFAVLELILQELRGINANLLAARQEGGSNQDIDLMKNTY